MAEELLSGVAGRLRLKSGQQIQVMRELHSHLEAGAHDLQLAGHPPERAMRETVDRFGDPAEVAEMLCAVHRPHIPKLKAIAAVTLCLGAMSAWFGTSGTFASSVHKSRHSAAHMMPRVRHEARIDRLARTPHTQPGP